jgi:hypothetical protein
MAGYYEGFYGQWRQPTGSYFLATTAGTSASVNANTVWNTWTSTTAVTSLLPPAWLEWNRIGTKLHSWPALERRQQRPRELSPEAKWKLDRRSAIFQRRQKVAALRKRVADRKAEALLLEHLDEAQRAEWTEKDSFTVYTAGGDRRWVIRRGLAGNVYLMEPRMQRFCIHEYHPDGRVPLADNVLAQKLLLEADEQRFLEIANVA